MTFDLARAAYAASQISSNLKGSTKQFGWLQAPATKISFLSAILRTLQPSEFICRTEIPESCVLKTLPRSHDGFGMIDSFRFARHSGGTAMASLVLGVQAGKTIQDCGFGVLEVW